MQTLGVWYEMFQTAHTCLWVSHIKKSAPGLALNSFNYGLGRWMVAPAGSPRHVSQRRTQQADTISDPRVKVCHAKVVAARIGGCITCLRATTGRLPSARGLLAEGIHRWAGERLQVALWSCVCLSTYYLMASSRKRAVVVAARAWMAAAALKRSMAWFRAPTCGRGGAGAFFAES